MNLLFLSGFGVQELIVLTMLLMAGIWIAAMIDIVRSNFTDSNQKVVWILIVIFVPFIGTILYFTLGRANKIRA